jgi:uncharacterized membrane protein YidH (DUF202 family)
VSVFLLEGSTIDFNKNHSGFDRKATRGQLRVWLFLLVIGLMMTFINILGLCFGRSRQHH